MCAIFVPEKKLSLKAVNNVLNKKVFRKNFQFWQLELWWSLLTHVLRVFFPIFIQYSVTFNVWSLCIIKKKKNQKKGIINGSVQVYETSKYNPLRDDDDLKMKKSRFNRIFSKRENPIVILIRKKSKSKKKSINFSI